MRQPLSPLVYFQRNLNRTVPITLVILFSVVMVASVVTVVRSINLTVYTLYGYNRYTTGIIPRNALAVDEELVARMRKQPHLARLAPVHSYTCLLRTIFGRLVFPIFGLEAGDRQLLMSRCRVTLAAGRLPAEGKPEAVISDMVARNLGVKIGDTLLQPDSEDAYAPVPIKLVGLLRGDVWLGLISKEFVDANSPFTWQGFLAFAPTPAQQTQLDTELDRVNDNAHARLWRFSNLVRETENSLTNLYLMLNIVIGIVVGVICFVCGLLSNIYFTQRLPEVATLSAIGYSRGFLLWRAARETILLCMLGWVLGAIVTVGLMTAIRDLLLAPRGLLINATDIHAYTLTLPLPIFIILFAILTVSLRLSRLDPVTIIERRQ
jgi:ABC-type lipoprotein release transport system permease subunit